MKNINLTIAESWNQLTAKQVLYVLRLLSAQLDNEKTRVLLFMHLTNIKIVWYRSFLHDLKLKKYNPSKFYFQKGGRQFSISPEELHFFLKKTGFIFDGCDLTENKFPVINAGLRKLHGPSAKCYNITFKEFIHTERQSFQYSNDKDEKALNKLCAILYRRPIGRLKRNNKNDIREPFNDFTYASRANRFRFVSPYKKQAVFLFYCASISAMVAKFSNLFSGSVSTSEPKNPVPGLIESVKLLAGFDPTKNDEILNMQVWQAFDYLDSIIKNKPKK